MLHDQVLPWWLVGLTGFTCMGPACYPAAAVHSNLHACGGSLQHTDCHAHWTRPGCLMLACSTSDIADHMSMQQGHAMMAMQQPRAVYTVCRMPPRMAHIPS